MIFCDTTAEIGSSFQIDRRRMDGGGGKTDRCGSQNSYLDLIMAESVTNFNKNCDNFRITNHSS